MNQNGNLAVPGAVVCASFGVQTEEALKILQPHPVYLFCFILSLSSSWELGQ